MAQEEKEIIRSRKTAQVIMCKGFLAGVNACIRELERKRESAECFLGEAQKELNSLMTEKRPASQEKK